jgi:hypothetical protein
MEREERAAEEERRGLARERLWKKQEEKETEEDVERENKEEVEEQVINEDGLTSTEVEENDPAVMETRHFVNVGDGRVKEQEEREREDPEEERT